MNSDQIIDQLKSSLIKIGVQEVMKALVSRLPFLAAWGINPIVTWLVGKVVKVLVNETEIGAFYIYQTMRTTAQAKEFEKAAIALQNAVTPEEKVRAEKAKIDAARALIKLTR